MSGSRYMNTYVCGRKAGMVAPTGVVVGPGVVVVCAVCRWKGEPVAGGRQAWYAMPFLVCSEGVVCSV